MSNAIKQVKKQIEAAAVEANAPIPIGKEEAQTLALMAQQTERLRYHSEQLHQTADKARQDWQVAQQGFERLMYKCKSDLGVKSDWALLRLEDGSLAFAPAPPDSRQSA